jgi:DNA polymerase-3 subunit beta
LKRGFINFVAKLNPDNGTVSDRVPAYQKPGMEQLDIHEYKEKMDRVAISAARDDTRPVLSGLLWQIDEGVINLVATDGYRLGLDKLTRVKGLDELKGKRFILPVRAVLELSRIAEGEGDEMKVEFDVSQRFFSLTSSVIQLLASFHLFKESSEKD